MSKLKKLIVLVVIVIVGVIIYFYPKPFKETYKDVQVYENGNKMSKVDIELDGEIHKAYWVWQRLKFSEELSGNITIDGEKYTLHPVDLYMFPDLDGNYTDNGKYECLLSNTDDVFYIAHDKSKLYIISGSKEFIYPSETDEDYQIIKEKMN